MGNTHTPGLVEKSIVHLLQVTHGTTDAPTDEQLVTMTGMDYADLRKADAAPELLPALDVLVDANIVANGERAKR